MSMLGSNGSFTKTSAPYAGKQKDVRDPTLTKLTRDYVQEATVAEAIDCPAGHLARLLLAEKYDPSGQHRICPTAPVFANSHTEGYYVEMHEESWSGHDGSSHAPESITFLCMDPAHNNYFCAAGTVFELPRNMSGAVRIYLPYPKSTYHGTPPALDPITGLPVSHGNVGSALVTRCV